jgi:hypothetical protein
MAFAAAALWTTAAAADPPDQAPEPIQPDRPGIADGSTVIGPGRFQTENGLLGLRNSAAGGEVRSWFTPTLLRFGLTRRWEARVETNGYSRASASAPGIPEATTAGYSPVSAGTKYQFQEASEGNGNLSAGMILRVFPPSGSSAFRVRHVNTDLRLAADWGFAKNWSLNPNVGVARYEDSGAATFVAALFATTLTYGPNNRLQPYIDVASQSPETSAGGTAVLLDGGATYLLDNNTQADFGIGTSLAGSTVPDFFWTVGLSRRFNLRHHRAAAHG